MADSITCPKCEMTSHHPMDVKMEFCGNCKAFHWALRSEEPIHYNAVVSAIMEKYRSRLDRGDPFTVCVSPFIEDGSTYWRGHIQVGSAVWNSSRRLHPTPADALRELAERVDAGMTL